MVANWLACYRGISNFPSIFLCQCHSPPYFPPLTYVIRAIYSTQCCRYYSALLVLFRFCLVIRTIYFTCFQHAAGMYYCFSLAICTIYSTRCCWYYSAPSYSTRLWHADGMVLFRFSLVICAYILYGAAGTILLFLVIRAIYSRRLPCADVTIPLLSIHQLKQSLSVLPPRFRSGVAYPQTLPFNLGLQ